MLATNVLGTSACWLIWLQIWAIFMPSQRRSMKKHHRTFLDGELAYNPASNIQLGQPWIDSLDSLAQLHLLL